MHGAPGTGADDDDGGGAAADGAGGRAVGAGAPLGTGSSPDLTARTLAPSSPSAA